MQDAPGRLPELLPWGSREVHALQAVYKPAHEVRALHFGPPVLFHGPSSMAQHYSMKHSATAMSETLQTAVALGKHEREHVLKLLKKRKLTAADNVCPGESCCPKKKGKAKA